MAAVVAGWVLGLVLAVVAMTRTLRFLHLAVSSVAIPANTSVAQVESLVSLALMVTAWEKDAILVHQKSATVRVAPSLVAVDLSLGQHQTSHLTVQIQKIATTISGQSSPSVSCGVLRGTMCRPYPLV